jgi:hypothetical protein
VVVGDPAAYILLNESMFEAFETLEYLETGV